MKRILSILIFLAAFTACNRAAHADWTYNAVVYELNVRQATPEGTLTAAAQRLPALRELGVDVVWLMPVHPIGVKERKGSLGSYYAIRDYYEINPEFGTMADFDAFVAEAHTLGLKVIMDCVANHTSPDARWIDEKPLDWYVRDSLGRTVVQYDWTDIAKLNYENADVRRAMTDMLSFWLAKGIDGFRCDMACEVPIDFWRTAFVELRTEYPDMYLLAEGENPALHEQAFDASYAWELHHILNGIAQGKKEVLDLKAYIEKDAAATPREAFRLMFTSNHDENSWSGTEFERMGDAAQAMAALTYVLPQGQPLIYTGQEVGSNRRLPFFEKDSIGSWEPNEYTEFYTRLNTLRHTNAALAAGERGGELVYMAGVVDNVLAFTREKGEDKVFCMFNLSDKPARVIYTVQAAGEYLDAVSGATETVTAGNEVLLNPWKWQILSKTEWED